MITLQGLSAAGISRGESLHANSRLKKLAQLPPLHDARKDPDLMVTRQVIAPLELPPLLNVGNRVDVIFRGCTPEPITEPRQATSLAEEARARGGRPRA